jgi:hypothetical protein
MTEVSLNEAETSNGAGATEAPSAAASAIERKVAGLRELAKSDPDSARDLTWTLFRELGARAPSSHEAANELGDVFRMGTPPSRIEGQTQGILVGFVWRRPVNVALRTLTGAWMPWLGKRFNATEGRGDNVLAGSARWPAKVLWPLYGTRATEGGRSAFDFETAIESSKDEPETEVMKIDYHDLDANPGMLIRSIRDELVEIVPGAYLGKMLWRHDAEKHTLLAYFALRQPAESD